MIDALESGRWLLIALLVAAAVSDARSLKIPNALPVLIALSALALLFINGGALSDFLAAIISGLAGLAVGYVLFLARLVGAGDGKLFASAAMWFPAGVLPGVGLLISIAGLFVGLFLFAVQVLGKPQGVNGRAAAAMKTRMPYGVPIAVGFAAAAQLVASV